MKGRGVSRSPALHPAVKPGAEPTVRALRQRIKAATALHQHEPHGRWIECDGNEYLASRGCATLRALQGRPR